MIVHNLVTDLALVLEVCRHNYIALARTYGSDSCSRSFRNKRYKTASLPYSVTKDFLYEKVFCDHKQPIVEDSEVEVLTASLNNSAWWQLDFWVVSRQLV